MSTLIELLAQAAGYGLQAPDYRLQAAGLAAGWALLHFVWQGALIGGLLWLALRALARRSPQLRYAVACAALLLMAAAPIAAFFLMPRDAGVSPARDAAVSAARPAGVSPAVVSQAPTTQAGGAPADDVILASAVPSTSPATAGTVPPAAPPSLAARITCTLEPALPYAVAIWLVGVIACATWHVGGYVKVQRLRRRGQPLAMEDESAAPWLTAADVLRGRFNLRRPVRLLKLAGAAASSLAGPIVVGVLRPAVLIPAAVITGLTPPHIEAILAHELAHIRRCDYLVNLLQTLVEALLFYHPAVWWVSARIRTEREHCCDDAALSALRWHGLPGRDAARNKNPARDSQAYAVAETRAGGPCHLTCHIYAAALAALAEIASANRACAHPSMIDRLAPAKRIAPGAAGSLLSRIRRVLGVSSHEGRHAARLAAVLVLVGVLAAAVFYGCGLRNTAQLKTSTTPDSMVVRVYDVSDLLMHIPEGSTPPDYWTQGLQRATPADAQAEAVKEALWRKSVEGQLAGLFKKTVSPASWAPAGKGSLAFLQGQIIVTQTPDNHAQIEALVAKLRDGRGIQIFVEVKVLRPDVASAPNADLNFRNWLDKNAGAKLDEIKKGIFLDDRQVAAAIEEATGKDKFSILVSPRLVLFNGQRGYYTVAERQAFLLPRLDLKDRTAVMFLEKGTTGGVEATVTADRKHVVMTLSPRVTQLVSQAGEKAPVVAVATGTTTVALPDNGTLLLRYPVIKTRAQGVKEAVDSAGKKTLTVQTQPLEKPEQAKEFVYFLFKPRIIYPAEAPATQPSSGQATRPAARQASPPATQPADLVATSYGQWSEPANGVQGRLVLKREHVMNGTGIVKAYLELKSVSSDANPMKVQSARDGMRYRVVDGQGKELPVTLGPYDGIVADTKDIVLPRIRSTATVGLSTSGAGIAGGHAAMIDLGATAIWTIGRDGKDYYLLATLEIQQKAGTDAGNRPWHGKLELPRAQVPLAGVPLDPAKADELIDGLGAAMLPDDDAGRKAMRLLSLIDDPRVVPWYVKGAGTGSYELKFHALDRLSNFDGEEALQGIRSCMNDRIDNIRHSAALALVRSPNPKAKGLLWTMKGDPSAAVRTTVVQAAGDLKTLQSLELLQEMANDSDQGVRSEALRYLKLRTATQPNAPAVRQGSPQATRPGGLAPDAQEVDEFFKAISAGDLAKVRAMLADKPTLVKTTDPKFRGSPLYMVARRAARPGAGPLGLQPSSAAVKGHQLSMIRIAKVLLDSGADINDRGQADRPPLHEAVIQACYLGWTGMVELLLQRGADPNARDTGDNTPLHFLADQIVGRETQAQMTVAKALLEAGADPMAERGRDAQRPYEIAATQGPSGKPVQELLYKAAEPLLGAQQKVIGDSVAALIDAITKGDSQALAGLATDVPGQAAFKERLAALQKARVDPGKYSTHYRTIFRRGFATVWLIQAADDKSTLQIELMKFPDGRWRALTIGPANSRPPQTGAMTTSAEMVYAAYRQAVYAAATQPATAPAAGQDSPQATRPATTPAAWGTAVEGLRVGIAPAGQITGPDAAVTFFFKTANEGKRPFAVQSVAGGEAQFNIDGERYVCPPPRLSDRARAIVRPGCEAEAEIVDLAKLQHAKTGKAVGRLRAGTHTVSIECDAELLDDQLNPDKGAKPIHVVSNVLTFELAAPATQPAVRQDSPQATHTGETQPATGRAAVVAAIAKELKYNIGDFQLLLQFSGDLELPSLMLTVPPGADDAPHIRIVLPAKNVQKVRITTEQAQKVIDCLHSSGWLNLACDLRQLGGVPGPRKPGYCVQFGERFYLDLGWGPDLLKELQGLRKALEGESAKAMDTLLQRLKTHETDKDWGRAATQPATAPAQPAVRALQALSEVRVLAEELLKLAPENWRRVERVAIEQTTAHSLPGGQAVVVTMTMKNDPRPVKHSDVVSIIFMIGPFEPPKVGPDEQVGKASQIATWRGLTVFALGPADFWPNWIDDIKAALAIAQAKAEQADFYSELYSRYKAAILKSVQAGDANEVSRLTTRFNETIGGKLLYVHVQRLAAGQAEKWELLLDKYFSDKRPILPKIKYADWGPRPHVHFEGDYVLIETAHLENNRYEDNLYITMAVQPIPAATQPAVRPGSPQATQPTEYHAYWLTRPERGEYVDLLITRAPIEKLGELRPQATDDLAQAPAVTVRTYSKDSIWNTDGKPFKAASVSDVDPAERTATVNGKSCKYSPASLAEVVKLLEKPEGTIPIHRTHAPLAGAQDFAKQLLAAMRQRAAE